MNRPEIESLIPHRDPFLWIDEVVEIADQRILAKKKIGEELDVFRGHYPHFPIFPGVLQLEAAFQAGAILIAKLRKLVKGRSQSSRESTTQNSARWSDLATRWISKLS